MDKREAQRVAEREGIPVWQAIEELAEDIEMRDIFEQSCKEEWQEVTGQKKKGKKKMKRIRRKEWRRVDSGINAVQEADWEVIEVTVNSGAVATVGPKSVANAFPLEETEDSKSGHEFYAANGTPIDNYGKRRIEGTVEEGHQVNLTMQVTDVVKVFGSVKQMVEAGNRVVFDKEGSYIEHKTSGKRTHMNEKGGGYTFNMKIRRGK